MIQPVVFKPDVDVDEQIDQIAEKPTVVSIMFVSDQAEDAGDAAFAALKFVRDFAVGMVPEGTLIGVMCDVEGTRTAMTIDYRSHKGVPN